MKRLFAITAAALCFCGTVSARNRIASVEHGPENAVLKYVAQTDSTTRIFGTVSHSGTGGDCVFLNVPRKIHVTDGDVDYKLLHSYNIPVADESKMEYALLEEDGQRINFVLEFEKFPVDSPFDIVCGVKGASSFEFKGVKADSASGKDVDMRRFLSSTPVVKCGQFFDEGHCCTFYDRDGVFTSYYATYGDDHFTIYLTIVNDSDHGILFNTDKINVIGHKLKGKEPVEVKLPLISKNEYVSIVASSDRAKAERETGTSALEAIGTAASFARLSAPFRSLEYTGLKILGGVVNDMEYNAIRPALNELDKTRAERTKNYLLSQSVKAGESISGFFRITRPRKVDDFVLTMKMDDYEFVFYDSVKK